METGRQSAVTIANPLGARQEATPASSAAVENIVSVVRQFSESLLTNRVSKEVKQEVKALVTHLEILVARRRNTANRARSPSVAETHEALKNLKRFLAQEAQKEKSKKTSGTCTSDSLDSSDSRVHAVSPCSCARTPLRHPSEEYPTAARACGSRDDTDNGSRRKLHPATALAREKLRLRCGVEPGPGAPYKAQLPEKECKQALRSCHVIHLTCSERHQFLVMPLTVHAAESADNQLDVSGGELVHVATEWAPPMCQPADSASTALPECQLTPTVTAADSTDCFASGARCFLRCRSPIRAERPPFVTTNRPMEETVARLQGELAVENVVEQPMLMAEVSCSRGGGERAQEVGTSGGSGCCCFGKVDMFGGIRSLDSHHGAVKCPVAKAVVAEQGNFNRANVSTRVAVVSWANATVAGLSVDRDSPETATGIQECSNPLLSTCSCPSDDACKDDGDQGREKSTEESLEIQTSSAAGMVLQQPESGRLGHGSIQAASVRLEQRVCESCSPEVVFSSTSITTVEEDPCVWQQPLFRIVDLFRLVRQAAPMARSGSPTEAVEVSVRRNRNSNTANDATAKFSAADAVWNAYVNADAVCDSVDCDSNSGGSKSTLELVDQVMTVAEAESESGAEAVGEVVAETQIVDGMTPEPTVSPVFPVLTSAGTEAVALGRTWSSCELGQSSGFTKLLLTLDKAAKRRREKEKKQRLPGHAPQRPTAVTGTCPFGNNSGSHRSHSHQCRPLLASTPEQGSPSGNALRQEIALKLAADSLAALSQSLEHCVRRVHEAADAINSSL